MAVAQTHANVKIGAAYTGLKAGFAGKTHVDIQDLAIMRAMPGMTVLAPVRRDRVRRHGPLGHRDAGARSTSGWAARAGRTCSGRTTCSSPGA